jgi:hypothetical protein
MILSKQQLGVKVDPWRERERERERGTLSQGDGDMTLLVLGLLYNEIMMSFSRLMIIDLTVVSVPICLCPPKRNGRWIFDFLC